MKKLKCVVSYKKIVTKHFRFLSTAIVKAQFELYK